MGPIEQILKLLGEYAGTVLGAALPVIGFVIWRRFIFYKEALAGRHSRNRIKKRLAHHGDLRCAYFANLRAVLDWVDSKLGTAPCSANSYGFALNLATFYPLVSLLLIWAATGKNTSGVPDLLPEDYSDWRRTIVLISATSNAYFLYVGTTTPGGWGRFYLALGAVGIAINGFVSAFRGVLSIAICGAIGGTRFTRDFGAYAISSSIALAYALSVADFNSYYYLIFAVSSIVSICFPVIWGLGWAERNKRKGIST